MKKQAFKVLLCFCCILLLVPMTAFAEVTATADGAAGPDALYVAGCPDAYPLEAYDADSGMYIGAAPAFLRLVSERTALNFAYIRAGAQDRRSSLARDHQVDLFFATSREEELQSQGEEAVRLFAIQKDGKSRELYCVFTSVLDEKERAAIRGVAESLTADEVAALLTEDMDSSFSSQRYERIRTQLGSALLLALAAAAVLAVLLYQSKHRASDFVDDATSIGNRQYFIRSFQSMMNNPAREMCYLIHFAFNIDWVNHNYGTDKSDEILRCAADVLSQSMKHNEFCARIGGGSFAAAIYCSNTEQAKARLKEMLRHLNEPGDFYQEGQGTPLFQAGVCALSMDDRNAEHVLSNAEQAYHRAVADKQAYVLADPDVLKEERIRAFIREQARDAIQNNTFSPYVQFIVDTRDASLRGGELLSRWQNRYYGQLKPGAYVPILEEMGLIGAHDFLMLENVCKILEQWHKKGKNLFLSCNLTRNTISDEKLVEKILALTDQYSFSRASLVIELTKDTLEEDKERARENIASLKQAGFRVGLDNFPSGYTALSNLYEYDVDLVKLDRQMIVSAQHNEQAATLLKGITDICHQMGIQVLAQGVENEGQNSLALSSGCDYIQGFYYARPLPLRELREFAEQFVSSPSDEPG